MTTMTKSTTDKRPPVIVVLGHVDHGKTTLLDYIRKTNVAAKEAGGITQSIGAYEIIHAPHESRTNAEINAEERGKIQRESAFGQRSSAEGDFTTGSRKITFIDTPGHEAFSKMRARGVKVADIAVLVVAVDDGVQPQTKEAIKIIREAKIPFVVALNKIDKQGVDINKVKNELTAEDVLLEGYGGNVSSQPISAKTGQGVPELLDLILFAAEFENLPFNLKSPGKGVVIESKLESRRGIVASAILKDGTLKVGEQIFAGSASGKIKGLENFLGKRIKEAVPSMPVLILGFEELPDVGAEFFVGVPPSRIEAKISDNSRIVANKISEDSRVVNLILKADVTGSLEALTGIIKNLPKPDKVTVRIIDEAVGDITDGDIQSAISSKAAVIGFKVKPTRAAASLAETHHIKIISSEIVYELVKALEEDFNRLDQTIVKGDLEILAVFGHRQGGAEKKGGEQIVGGRVLKGEIQNNATLDIERRESVLGSAKIINLQQAKKDVQSVAAGNEGGLLLDSEVMIRVGDHLILR